MKNKILKIILASGLWLLATFGFAEEFLAADNDYKITIGGYFLCTKKIFVEVVE